MTAYRYSPAIALVFLPLSSLSAIAHTTPKHSAAVRDAKVAECVDKTIGVASADLYPTLYACEHDVPIEKARSMIETDEAIEKKAVMEGLDARDRMCNSPGYVCGTISIEH
ncbi:MAG: hypothetical protein ACTHPD_06230 [Rhizomicrobium sp.]